MTEILKEDDRVIDTDGDTGYATEVRGEPGEQRFTMNYDKGTICRSMFFCPIDDPEDLGFKIIEG